MDFVLLTRSYCLQNTKHTFPLSVTLLQEHSRSVLYKYIKVHQHTAFALRGRDGELRNWEFGKALIGIGCYKMCYVMLKYKPPSTYFSSLCMYKNIWMYYQGRSYNVHNIKHIFIASNWVVKWIVYMFHLFGVLLFLYGEKDVVCWGWS